MQSNNTPLTQVGAVILAAGKGTRMAATDKNKVVYPLDGRPLVVHTLTHLKEAGINHLYAVVGFQADSVRAALGDQVTYILQREQLGTGHALQTAFPALSSTLTTVLSVYGDDSAFYPAWLYRRLAEEREKTGVDILVLTAHHPAPNGLGRIVRDAQGKIVRIVEQKNATPAEKKIQEINTGFYCFSYSFLARHLDKLIQNPLSGEYYATDLVEIALAHHGEVATYLLPDQRFWHGVNTPAEYAQAHQKISELNHG